MFVVKWAKNEATLLQFEEMLTQAFENAGQFIHLKAVHSSFLTLICAARNWAVDSLIQVARESISVLRDLGVVKLTIGQEVIFYDKEVHVLENLHVIIVPLVLITMYYFVVISWYICIYCVLLCDDLGRIFLFWKESIP